MEFNGDRRRYPRVQVNTGVEINLEGQVCVSRAKDISENGVLVVSPIFIPEFTIFEMGMALPGKTKENIFVTCVAVRTEKSFEGWEIGLFFAKISDADRRKMRRLVTRQVKNYF